MAQHVYIGLVTYSGDLEPETGKAITRSAQALTDSGVEVTLDRIIQNSLIADARNLMLARFLASSATDLVFIDRDVAWDGDELERLVKYPVDLVAGAYRQKCEPARYPVRFLDKPFLQADPQTGLLEVETAPTGLMRISRACLERMIATFADRIYLNDNAPHSKAWCLFDCGLSDGQYWGEDYTFCQRWRQGCGGQVWIDPTFTLHHVGSADPTQPLKGRKVYTGCIGDWLKNRSQEDFDGNVGVKINLCIPTRGKSEYLTQFVAHSLANAVLPTTRFVIGVDEDDEDGKAAAKSFNDPRVIVSIKPREDALGAKYNRCAAEYDADLYIMGLDDVGIATPGWDRILAENAARFPDGIGVMYFGKEPHGEDLPSMQAMTKRFVELQGFFCPPYFPFWWNNTWTDEVARMIGRVGKVPIETRYPTKFDKPKRRDLMFWAEHFDDTRPQRIATADRMIAEIRKSMTAMFEKRNAALRDPEFTKSIETDLSTAEELDDRHKRLREAAMKRKKAA